MPALKRHPATKGLDTMFDVTLKPGSGEVLITGMVDNEHVSEQAERAIGEVDGVKSVRNQLLIANNLQVGP